MRLVLDTNIIFMIISPKSNHHWLLRKLQENKFTLCVSSDVLNEYEEVIGKYYTPMIAESLMETLGNLPNVEKITKYFRWGLIKTDYDDNKFVDCAIACNADYIVTHDNHFNELQNVPFPNVNIINIHQLKEILE